MNNYYIERALDQIKREYNPERDIIADDVIPWYVARLVDAIELLAEENENLRAEIDAMVKRMEAAQ